MDTRFLETFVAVIENGSIAAAARRLDITPAAVSQRIQALQEDIGIKLLFRSGRTVSPTRAGTAILERARGLLSDVRDLRSIASQDSPAGELRLGVIQTVLSGLLPGILCELALKYPQIAVSISRQTASELYAKVLDGELDAAIFPEPTFAIPKTCDWQLLRREPLVLLTPSSEPHRDPQVILASRPFIRQKRSTWAGRLIDGYLRSARIQPVERFEIDGFESIAIMVDRGLGVSLVHDWAPPWPESLSVR